MSLVSLVRKTLSDKMTTAFKAKEARRKLPGHPQNRKREAPEREDSWGHKGLARKVE